MTEPRPRGRPRKIQPATFVDTESSGAEPLSHHIGLHTTPSAMSIGDLDPQQQHTQRQGASIFLDAQGKPLQICISRTVKNISDLENKIKAHGGEVTWDERTAYISLADPGHKYLETMYSTEWVDYCIEKQALVNHNTTKYRLGIANRTEKSHYSLEDDYLLRQFIKDKLRIGAKVKGNRIYQDFAIMNKQHSWQSWRDRAVRVLKLTDPLSPYEVSRARREEQLKKLEETRAAPFSTEATTLSQAVHEALSQANGTDQQEPLIHSATTVAQQLSEKMEGPQTMDTNDVTDIGSFGEKELQTQAFPSQTLACPFDEASEIESDYEDDFHSLIGTALSQKDKDPHAWQRVQETLKQEPVWMTTGRGKSPTVTTPPAGSKRRLSLSPVQTNQRNIEMSQASAIQSSRLSLPNMSRLGQKSPMLLMTVQDAPSAVNTGRDSKLSPSVVSSTTDETSASLTPQTLQTLSTWRNPPQAHLSIPDSIPPSIPSAHEADNTGEAELEDDAQDNYVAKEVSSKAEELELLDKDDIATEYKILAKMKAVGSISSKASEESSLIYNQEADDEHGTHFAEGERNDEGPYHGFVLPEKLLVASKPIASRRTSRARTMRSSQSASPSPWESKFYSAAADDNTSELDSQLERAPSDDNNMDENKISGSQKVLEHAANRHPDRTTRRRSPVQEVVAGAEHEEAQGVLMKTKQESRKEYKEATSDVLQQKEQDQIQGEHAVSHVNDDGALVSEEVAEDIAIDEMKQGNQIIVEDEPRDKSSKGYEVDEDEEEEVLVRRGRKSQLSQGAQGSPTAAGRQSSPPMDVKQIRSAATIPNRKMDEKLRQSAQVDVTESSEGTPQIEPERPARGVMRQDAVQEFYGADIVEDQADTDRVRRDQLLLYLHDLYHEEIRTLVMYELVPQLKAIDILDACSGDLELARAFINDGMTDEIQGHFWTGLDDSRVFSKKKEDEIALVQRHSFTEIFRRLQYLTKTRREAERFAASPEAIDASGLLKRKTRPMSTMLPRADTALENYKRQKMVGATQ
ncbi:hypothetical protein EDD11_008717 [Mortierella claussenii]|nr:hypothetical protein EDD11_008717 [Mortierella claussenii]